MKYFSDTEPLPDKTEKIAQMKLQSKRQSKQKVRTGCFTCKIRRVKCDEGKPYCQRCLKFGALCDGYTAQPGRYVKTSSTGLPIQPRPTAPVIKTLDIPISTNSEECRYFYLYRQHTASILSGYFRSNFWSRLVPQIGHDAEPIRYGIIAVTALLKSLETASRSPLLIGAQEQKNCHYRFAIQAYTRAISSLRSLISADGSDYNTALIASVIFVVIETLQGDLVTASTQIVGAFHLAAEAVRCQTDSRKARKNHFTLDNDLVQILTNLEFQSKLPVFYAGSETYQGIPSLLAVLPQSSVLDIPSSFESLDTAKASLSTILNCIGSFYARRSRPLESSSAISEKHHTLLKQWMDAFSPFMCEAVSQVTGPGTRSNLPMDSKDYAPQFSLASTHALAVIIVKSKGGRCSEMFYDSLTAEFQRIIDCSTVIISTMRLCTLPRYSFEIGILPPLHVAASKCRIPKLRREAIELLRQCTAQEGVWEGHGCAEACEWVMGIEESGSIGGWSEREVVGEDDGGSVPEWNRVKLTSMVCWLHERKIWAQCASVLPVARGERRELERTYTW